MTKRIPDPFQSIDQLDRSVIQTVVERLDSVRATRPSLTGAIRISAISTCPAQETCWMSAVERGWLPERLRSVQIFRERLSASIPASDCSRQHSASADGEQVSSRIEFRVGNAVRLEFADGTFDRLVAHTTFKSRDRSRDDGTGNGADACPRRHAGHFDGSTAIHRAMARPRQHHRLASQMHMGLEVFNTARLTHRGRALAGEG